MLARLHRERDRRMIAMLGLLLAAVLLFGCSGDGGVSTRDIPFAQEVAGEVVYQVRPVQSEIGRVGQPTVSPDLLDELNAIEGVQEVVGFTSSPNIQLYDGSGEPFYWGGHTVGATWSDIGLASPVAVVEGVAPTGDQFMMNDGAAIAGGFAVGESYELRLESDVRTLELSGTYISRYHPEFNRVFLDSPAALRYLAPSGEYHDAVLVAAVEGIDRTLEEIATALSNGLEVVRDDSIGAPEPSSDPLAKEVCKYLDDGGNSLIRIVEMAREYEPERAWAESFAVAEALGTQCPNWEPTSEAGNLLLMVGTSFEESADDARFEVKALVGYWTKACESLANGEAPESGAGGLDVFSDDQASAGVAVLGIIGICPEHGDTLRSFFE